MKYDIMVMMSGLNGHASAGVKFKSILLNESGYRKIQMAFV